MKSLRTQRIAWILWIIGGLLLLLITFLGRIPIPPMFAVFAVLFVLLIFCLFILLGLGLALCYRMHWERWQAWLALIILIGIAGTLIQQPIMIGPVSFEAAATLIFVGSGTAFVTALAIVLFRYDIGLALIAWLSMGAMWALVIWWVIGGDFLEPILRALISISADRASNSLFCLGVLVMTSICLIPLALASILVHSARLVRRELRKQPLPIE